MATPSKNQIAPLTGIRFLAASLVVAHHFAGSRNQILSNLLHHSFVGVTVFFVLSGFILAYNYSLGPGSMRGDIRSFWVARIARLYPVYLIGVLLFLPINFGDEKESVWFCIESGLLSLIAGQAWLHPLSMEWGIWNHPGWSLSAEAFFYTVFPFFCILLSRLSTSRLLAFGLACWALSIAPTITYITTGYILEKQWTFFPLIRLPEFLMGITAGLIWKRRASVAFDKLAPSLALVSMIALFFSLCLSLNTIWYVDGMVAPLAVVLICSLACNRGVIAKIFSWKPLVFLGGASYSLYILHWPIWTAAQNIAERSALGHLPGNLFFVIVFIFAVITSCLCFKYIEEPANKALRQRLAPKASKSSVAVVDADGIENQISLNHAAVESSNQPMANTSAQVVLRQEQF